MIKALASFIVSMIFLGLALNANSNLEMAIYSVLCCYFVVKIESILDDEYIKYHEQKKN